MKTEHKLFYWLNGFNVADLITTFIGVMFLGATELNPFVWYVWQKYGFIALTLSKLLLIGGASYFILMRRSPLRKLNIVMALFVVVLYEFIVFSNFISINERLIYLWF